VKTVGFGAGGHARVVIEALRATGVEVVGLYDSNPDLTGTSVLGVTVLGVDVDSAKSVEAGVRHAFIGVGSTDTSFVRLALYRRVLDAGFAIVAVIHPSAIVSPSASIGNGPTIMAAAIVNAGSILGDNVIVNTGAIVEHDCQIGHHVHIATGSKLAGGVNVGDGAHVGVGAVIRQNTRIGRNALVGAGAVVVHEVPDNAIVVGNPARVLRFREYHA